MNPVRRRILVIDGDAATRTLIVRALRAEGFLVTAVDDGSAALRALEHDAFALLITELHLPGPLDGLTTARQARAVRPTLRCLFMSALSAVPVWDNREADDFIAKPFVRRDLVGCVFELLHRPMPGSDAGERNERPST